MKFLIISENVPGVPGLPPDQALAMVKEQWAWVKRMKEAGKVETSYALADHGGGLLGGCGIIDVKSLEDLAEMLATMPVARFTSARVYPLVAPEVTERIIEGRLAAFARR